MADVHHGIVDDRLLGKKRLFFTPETPEAFKFLVDRLKSHGCKWYGGDVSAQSFFRNWRRGIVVYSDFDMQAVSRNTPDGAEIWCAVEMVLPGNKLPLESPDISAPAALHKKNRRTGQGDFGVE